MKQNNKSLDVEHIIKLHNALATFLNGVAENWGDLDDQQTQDRYHELYKEIKNAINDPKFEIYAPPMEIWRVVGGSDTLWKQHASLILNAGRQVLVYLDSVVLIQNAKSDYMKEKVSQKLNSQNAQNSVAVLSQPNKKAVWVIHGRNLKISDSMFQLLRAIGCEPLEWGEAKAKTDKASPFVGEILDTAFSYAQAVIVLLTGDDLAYLKEEYQLPDDKPYEKEPTPQARPNVLFEYGMAMGSCPDRTVLIQIEETRPFSDIAGRHIIKFDDSPEKRKELIDVLVTAGVLVDITGKKDWLTVGDFSIEGKGEHANKAEEKIVEEFARIKNIVLYTRDLGNLYPNLRELRNFFFKHSEVLKRSDFELFFNKWLADPLVERGERIIGIWIDKTKTPAMKKDLAKLEI